MISYRLGHGSSGPDILSGRLPLRSLEFGLAISVNIVLYGIN